MVRLYVWGPTSVTTVIKHGIMPDLGHAALEVMGNEEPRCYVSFWPEMNSAIGQMTDLFKGRLDRFPVSYAQESDPTDGYMQRPADHIATLTGLHEDRILQGWRRLQHLKYDFLSWNCSNVAKFLLIRSMSLEDQARLREYLGCNDDNLDDLNSDSDEAPDSQENLESLTEHMRRLALTDFIKCIPDDLVVLALALQKSREEIPEPNLEPFLT